MHKLEESQRWCAALMRTHASSFYLSTRLLPKAKRQAIEALYGFCRFADDTADEPGPTLAQRREIFLTIKRDLGALALGAEVGVNPWFQALRRAFARFPIRLADAFALVAGCEADLEPADIATLEDLERYSSAVAGTVGRFTVAVLGASDDDSLRRANLLGIAMQMTNVLRDVEEDAALGRNYLPRAAFPRLSAPAVMAIVAQRARAYYREAAVLSGRVPNDGSRVAIMLAAGMYEGILDKIDARDYDSSLGRAMVPRTEKMRLMLRSILAAYTGFSTIK